MHLTCLALTAREQIFKGLLQVMGETLMCKWRYKVFNMSCDLRKARD